MKKYTLVLLLLVLIVGCSSNQPNSNDNRREETTAETSEPEVKRIDFSTLEEEVMTYEVLRSLAIVYTFEPDYIEIYSNPARIKTSLRPILDAVAEINHILGFRRSVMERIETTKAIDGTLSEENDLYIISWNYSPKKGLRVIYEYK